MWEGNITKIGAFCLRFDMKANHIPLGNGSVRVIS